jgi:hypothetical protein
VIFKVQSGVCYSDIWWRCSYVPACVNSADHLCFRFQRRGLYQQQSFVILRFVTLIWAMIKIKGKLQNLSHISILCHSLPDSLRAGRPGDGIPMGTRFSAPIQTGSGAHPVSYTTGSGCLSGVKWAGGGVSHPPLSSVEVEERVEVLLYSPLSRSSWPVLGQTLLLLTIYFQCLIQSSW